MSKPNLNKDIEKNAVWNGTHYEHFGIMPEISGVYGHTPENISTVKIKISGDQSRPPSNDIMGVDYWGWFDFKQQDFTMIYAKRFLLNMCFTYGIEASEKANEGKAYRLEVIT